MGKARSQTATGPHPRPHISTAPSAVSRSNPHPAPIVRACICRGLPVARRRLPGVIFLVDALAFAGRACIRCPPSGSVCVAGCRSSAASCLASCPCRKRQHFAGRTGLRCRAPRFASAAGSESYALPSPLRWKRPPRALPCSPSASCARHPPVHVSLQLALTLGRWTGIRGSQRGFASVALDSCASSAAWASPLAGCACLALGESVFASAAACAGRPPGPSFLDEGACRRGLNQPRKVTSRRAG
jgi:hypothetical protein